MSNCKICGKPLNGRDLVYDIDLEEVFCRKCAPFRNTCVFCINKNSCDFNTNPSPLPKQVQQTQRTGNAVMTQIVKNPERIKITCENGCPCYSSEFGCGKEVCMECRCCPSDNWSKGE